MGSEHSCGMSDAAHDKAKKDLLTKAEEDMATSILNELETVKVGSETCVPKSVVGFIAADLLIDNIIESGVSAFFFDKELLPVHSFRCMRNESEAMGSTVPYDAA